MAQPTKPKLTLIQGGNALGIEGPIARLGLTERVTPVSSRVWVFVFFAKGALLASILYYFFG